MIFVYNLPRSFGQTIQEMLSILYHAPERGVDVWHSLYGDTWLDLKRSDIGVVECWHPISWSECRFSDAKYILVTRANEDAWFDSCADMYDLAQQELWTHPIWKLDLDQFLYYAPEWYSDVYLRLARLPKGRTMTWKIQECGPDWESLCTFLNMPIPDVLVPWVDYIGGQTGLSRLWSDRFLHLGVGGCYDG